KTSELVNTDENGQYLRLESIDGLIRKAVALQDKYPVVVPLNKELNKGIHSVTVKFDKCNQGDHVCLFIGIAKQSHKIICPCKAWEKSNNANMIFYHGHDGWVKFRGDIIYGNAKFSDNQLITMELNMDNGTLHFIVDGVQQPVFVRGIKEKVKLYWEIYYQDSSFTVQSVKLLNAPTVKKLDNEKAIDW
ncbi:MAG: hypothetical protein EZS28_041732, partial [Streblomastix strix]